MHISISRIRIGKVSAAPASQETSALRLGKISACCVLDNRRSQCSLVRLGLPPSCLDPPPSGRGEEPHAERRRQRGRDAQDGLHHLEDRGSGGVLPRPDPDSREGDAEPRVRVPGVRGRDGADEEERRGEEGEEAPR